MKKFISRFPQLGKFDIGYLIVLGIALIAIWPFISRASLPAETDAELHIFRLHELTLLIQGGEIYPRWAPNFYHGYGYPIFNYYAPLSYYVGLFSTMWAPFDAVDGVKFVFVLGLLLAGIATYGFVRDNWGRSAGLIATAVYLYAPYIQYVDPHARGVLAESFSFGIFPLALWALDRFQRTKSRWALVTAVPLISATIMTHNLMGLLFFGILASWVAWGFVFKSDGQRNWQPFMVLFLGLCGAAFFWIPVFLERDAVNLNTLLGEGDNFDFRTHFLSIRDLLASS
ncbi:MAG: 6-pyruvoyl-tetrahydropterin synthase-related protein, partial [Chloroflexota bacterium]